MDVFIIIPDYDPHRQKRRHPLSGAFRFPQNAFSLLAHDSALLTLSIGDFALQAICKFTPSRLTYSLDCTSLAVNLEPPIVSNLPSTSTWAWFFNVQYLPTK